MAKGAGMLAPALATMLVVVTTDAVVTAEQADEALRTATSLSFDRIDSDGCMSTNDTVFLLASGASGVAPDAATLAERRDRGVRRPRAAADRRRRGASKDIEIVVGGAAPSGRARGRARGLAQQPAQVRHPRRGPQLGTGAVGHRHDAAAFDSDAVDVAINGVWVCRGGGIGESRDLVDMAGRGLRISVDLHAGDETATIWTNDLTADYVHENSAYAT